VSFAKYCEVLLLVLLLAREMLWSRFLTKDKDLSPLQSQREMITMALGTVTNAEIHFPCALVRTVPSQLVLGTSETHSLPPPSVHSSLLHLTAEVSHRLALEQTGGSFHLLRIRYVFAVHFGDA